MAYFLLAIALIVLFLVQSVVLSPFGLWFPTRPDLLLLFVIGWTLAFGPGMGLAAAVVSGLLLDSASAAPMGSHVLASVFVVPLALFFERQRVASKTLFIGGLVVLATALYYVILLGARAISGAGVDLSGHLFYVVVPTALTNLVVCPLFILGAEALAGRTGARMRAGSGLTQPVSRGEV